MTPSNDSFDKELAAVKVVFDALLPLDNTGRRWVLDTATNRLGLALPNTTLGVARHEHDSSSQSKSSATSSGSDGSELIQEQTPKQFIKLKQPNTEVQRITCLGYYLTHVRKQAEFKTADLNKLNDEAGGEALSNPSMIVGNATSHSKFFAPAGSGMKRITSRGEQLVEALPNQEAVKATLPKLRKPRKNQKPSVVKAGK